jgi:hypothetical protein
MGTILPDGSGFSGVRFQVIAAEKPPAVQQQGLRIGTAG